MAANAGNQPRPYAQAAAQQQTNGGPPMPTPMPGAVPLLPNQGRIIQQGPIRVLCIADVRGNLRSLNELAREARASYIIHTGDFGFYDDRSLDRIAEKTLRHVAQYSPLLSESVKRQIAQSPPQPSIKDKIPRDQLPLSELPLFLNGTYKLDVPVYTVWGACEDVQVLEKLRSGEYKINNLNIIDEANSRLLDIGGVKLRLLGLGGAVVMHKLFDNGEGRTTIAGGQGTMWTTLLQMGELIDTANRVYDPTETRIFITHASPAREGLLNQLSVTLKADFSISAGLHFRYGSSYNEFSVNPTLDHYRGKLAASHASFDDVWQTVKNEVEPAVEDNESQKRLLSYALDLVSKMPQVANGGNPFGGQSAPGSGTIDESAFKNMWNFNLADAAYGWLVLDIEGGRIGTEMRAQGFNFAHRGGKAQQSAPAVPAPTTSAPTTGNTQAPSSQPPPSQSSRAPSGPTTQTRPTGPQPARSPAPATPKEPGKSTTPQPPATSTASQAPVEKEAKTNGTEKSGDSSKDPPQDRKPVQALFIRNVKSDNDACNLVAEEDRANIDHVEHRGSAYIVHFKGHKEMTDAFARLPAELKERQSDPSKPTVAVYREPAHRGGAPRGGAAGNWGPRPAGSAPGYRSASDSEGGRGGMRGGRGTRGASRGDRSGRGGRSGAGARGASGKGAESSATPSNDSKPAPSGGDS
ncbi:uncharacterized protein PV09_04690 [Verruconis gallopava]|uniref:Uncharacterized protein n=1 Tax=Verruconis gallopava TaxID=253628 RepID=A0A0D1XPC7_9PEZI|nr:uncharacterized protein PV09_04690 [Verruconis gallopava]KIW04416.1 hypothetical protein PV09_04690 [Verruconis gallopava]